MKGLYEITSLFSSVLINPPLRTTFRHLPHGSPRPATKFEVRIA